MVPPKSSDKDRCDIRHKELMRVAAEIHVVNKLMWICTVLLATGLIKIFLEGN